GQLPVDRRQQEIADSTDLPACSRSQRASTGAVPDGARDQFPRGSHKADTAPCGVARGAASGRAGLVQGYAAVSGTWLTDHVATSPSSPPRVGRSLRIGRATPLHELTPRLRPYRIRAASERGCVPGAIRSDGG